MTERKNKVEFICINKKCMEDGTGGCTLSFFTEDIRNCDTPNYCPYELEPADNKFVPWRQLK